MNLEETVAKHDQQIANLLVIMETVVDRQNRLDGALVDIAEAHKELLYAQKAQTESARERDRKLDERLRELAEAQKADDMAARERERKLDERLRELAEAQKVDDMAARERDRKLDERIEKLVSAIGEMLRRPQ